MKNKLEIALPERRLERVENLKGESGSRVGKKFLPTDSDEMAPLPELLIERSELKSTASEADEEFSRNVCELAKFSSPQEMEQAFLRLKEEGKFPLLISIYTHRAEIRPTNLTEAMIGGAPFGDARSALITDIVAGKCGVERTVIVDSQESATSAQAARVSLTVDQAFNATRSLSGAEYMKYMEDWMRQAKIEGKYSSRKLYSKLLSFAEGAVRHWQALMDANPELADADRELTFAAFAKMREKLPIRERTRLPSELPEEFRTQLLSASKET